MVEKEIKPQEKIQFTSEEFNQIFDAIDGGVCVIDKDFNLLQINSSLSALWDLKKSEVVGKKCYEVFHSCACHTSQCPLIRISGGEKKIECKIEKNQTKGSAIYQTVKITSLRSPAGRLKGIILNFKDITDQKQAQIELQESEGRYRSFVQNFKGIAYQGGLDFKVIFFHGAVEAVTGYTEAEFIAGKRWDQLIHPDDLPEIYERDTKRLWSIPDYSNEREYRIIRKDGKIRWVHDSIQNFCDDAGKPIGVQGALYDITEQKQTEIALRNYQKAVEGSQDLVAAIDFNYVYLFINEAFLKYRSMDQHQVIGHTVTEILGEEVFQKTVKPQIDRCLQGEYVEYEMSFHYPELKERHLHVSYNPLKADDGKVTGAVSIIRDITEQKSAQRALERTENKLKAMLESIGDHMSMMDEELNIIWANKIARGLFGDDIIGKKCYQVYHKREKPCEPYPCLTLKTFDDGGLHECETSVITKEGAIKHFSCTSTVALRDNFGKPSAVIEVSRDITEQKLAESSLRESEQRLSTIFDSVQAGIIIIDKETHTIVDANQVATKMLCASREKIIGSVCYKYICPAENGNCPLTDLGRDIHNSDCELLTLEGKSVPILKTVVPVVLNGREHLLESFLNITQRKLADEELRQSLEKLRKSMGMIINAMAMTVETRDPYTAGHQRRVADLARAIADGMGLPKDQIDGIRMAGVIHDLGKISVPAEILSKPGRITEIEFNLIKIHPQVGYDILKTIEFPWPVAQAVLQHHERMDSSGYPAGVSGEKIIIEARILAVADVVEAMASHRPYRPALGIKKSLDHILQKRGLLYDPPSVDACLNLFNKKGFTFK